MRPPGICIVLVLVLMIVAGVMGQGSVARAAVARESTLSISGNQGQALGPLAAADNAAVVVGASRAFIFTKAGSTWPTEEQSAILADSSGATPQPGVVSLAGSTAVVGETGGGKSFEDVFSEPAGGWTGTINEAATLVASDGAVLYGATTDGSEVEAVGVLPSTGTSSLYVFAEPADGWRGLVHQSAVLTDSKHAMLSGGAIEGRYIFGSAGTKVDVFQEPPGGWTGERAEVATLSAWAPWAGNVPMGPIATAPGVVAAGTYVFTEPAQGWGRGARPAALLVPAGAATSGFVLAAADNAVALSTSMLGVGHGCPCTGGVWVFSKPARGWSGLIAATASVQTSSRTGPIDVALDGDHLFVSGQPAISVYAITGPIGRQAGPPRVSAEPVLGLRSGRPRLSWTVSSGSGAPRIRAIAVTLPRGLGLAARGRRDTGITVSQARPTVLSLQGHRLLIDCPRACATLSAVLRAPALTESAELKHRARQRQRLALRIVVQVTYVGDRPITVTLRLPHH